MAGNTADESSTARSITVPEGAVNMNIGMVVGSYATVARLLDEAAEVPETGAIMLIIDAFPRRTDDLGTHVQPLMRSRAGTLDRA